MSKNIHIHLHSTPTHDAGNWEEGKHPRAENGQFGKGSGGGKAAPAAKKSAPAKKSLHKNKAGFNQSSPDPKAKPAPIKGATATGQSFLPRQSMNMGNLKEGQALYDKQGQKVDHVESISKHPLGGWRIETRAGYSHRVDASTGRNAHGLSNEPPINAGSNGGQPSRPAHHGIEAQKHERASKAPGASVEQQKSHERARWFHEHASKAAEKLDQLEASGTKSGATEVARKDYEYYSSEAKKASEAANKPAPVRSPQYTPMRQAMRNQEASGIKEARRVMKQPDTYNVEGQKQATRSIAAQQSEATLAEVMARINARKK